VSSGPSTPSDRDAETVLDAGCGTWNFAGPEETEARLLAAGFSSAECWLEEQTARPDEPRAFLQASGLAPVRELLDPESFEAFTDRMMALMGQPETFQYVRLNIVAERSDRGQNQGDSTS